MRLLERHYLRDEEGRPWERNQVDPESIRLRPDGRGFYWTSEGDARRGVAPFVAEADSEGVLRRRLPLPDHYRPGNGRGVRDNRAFESLALSPDGARLYAATENALLQDGPAADGARGSPCRVLVHDTASGGILAEWVYETEPVPAAPALPLLPHTNGLVELLALDDGRLLALERAYTAGKGNTVRLYLADPAGATDVRGRERLAGADYRPLAKTLIADLGELGAPLENLEGMSWGPPLADGRRRLVVVSDDNFSPTQRTLFLVFALRP